MLYLEEAIIIGMASWRIAHMAIFEDGPALVFEHLRTKLGVNKPGIISGFLPTLFSCVFCLSVWSTIAAYFLWIIEPTIVMIIAAMSIALIANQWGNPK